MRTDLDAAVLHWLLQLPFLRLDDLTVLLRQHRSTVARHLQQLVAARLVDAVDVAMMVAQKSGRCLVYHLTDIGLRQVAAHRGIAPGPLARAWNADEAGLLRMLPRLPDLLRVQDFVTAFCSGVQARSQPQPNGGWQWVRDYHHPFLLPRQQRAVARVDAVVAVRVGAAAQPVHYLGAFLLVDQRVVDWSRVKHDLTRLTQFRESAERVPVYQHFPALLVLSTSRFHAERWQRAIADVALALGMPPLVGGILLPGGPDNPWDPQQEWRHTVTGKPINLASLIRALPAAALPPQISQQGTWMPSVMAGPPVTRRRVIRGDFSERAAQITQLQTPMHLRLAALTVPAAQQRLLDQIALAPRMPLGELARWVEQQPASVARAVRALQARHFVVVGPMAQERPVSLSPLGTQLLAVRYHLSPRATVVRTALRRSPRTVTHDVGMYHFCLDLCDAARSHPGWEVSWWEPAPFCVQRFKDIRGHWHMVRPDAAGLLQSAVQRRHWWLEWDRGTMDTGDLRSKFRAYAVYIAAAHWRTRSLSAMPLILCVVPDRQQLDRFRRVATTILPDPTLFRYEAVITLAGLLATTGPLGAIWGPLHGGEPWRLRPCFVDATQAS